MPSANDERQSCFVIMPYGGLSDQYYTQVYAPAISDAQLTAFRADEVFRAGSILQDIVDRLSSAAVVLADLTEPNRNVHYELGLAHALGKPTVLVAPENLPLFFDVGYERIITYNKDMPAWGTELRTALSRALLTTLQDPASAVPTAFIHLKPTRQAADEVTLRLRRIDEQLTELLRLTSHTTSTPSRLQSIIRSLPSLEAEAERLLTSMTPEEALQRLIADGHPPYMSDAAVAVAASRLRSRSNKP